VGKTANSKPPGPIIRLANEKQGATLKYIFYSLHGQVHNFAAPLHSSLAGIQETLQMCRKNNTILLSQTTSFGVSLCKYNVQGHILRTPGMVQERSLLPTNGNVNIFFYQNDGDIQLVRKTFSQIIIAEIIFCSV
jgi:hypothetical protein